MITSQDILFKKLCYILHRSLVEARNVALQKDHNKLVDLADTFEIIPSLIADWQDDNLPMVRQILAAYQVKYKDSAYDYLSLLDMDDERFVELYDSKGGYR